MSTTPVHVAVFDTLADWEIGYATAHIRRDSWQRQPGRYSIVTVGPTREPVTTMGGLRITPDIALAELRPQDSAMLILAGGDRWDQDSMAGFRAAARRFLAAGVPVAAICGATYRPCPGGAARRPRAHQQCRRVPGVQRVRRKRALSSPSPR